MTVRQHHEGNSIKNPEKIFNDIFDRQTNILYTQPVLNLILVMEALTELSWHMIR